MPWVKTYVDNDKKPKGQIRKSTMEKTERNLAFHFSGGGMLQTQKMDGREHLVAPVVMMVEGVRNGILYSGQALSTFPQAFNGRPFVIHHPKDIEGNHVTANQPAVLDKVQIGQVFNCLFETGENGMGRLKGEVWVDVDKAQKAEGGSMILHSLKSGSMLEVSIACFEEDEMKEGTFDGLDYEMIAHHLRPDHLAVLPGAVGSCSCVDGCGVPRVNEEAEDDSMQIILDAAARKLGHCCHSCLVRHELSYNDIRRQIQMVLDDEQSSGSFAFVVDIFDDKFIYETEVKGVDDSAPSISTFRRGYTAADDGVSLSEREEAEQVQRVVSYEPVKQPTAAERRKQKQTGGDGMDKTELVQNIIDSEASKFSDQNREWLDGLGEDVLQLLVPNESKQEPKPDEGKGKQTPEQTPTAVAALKAFEEAMGSQQQQVDEVPQTAEEFISEAPEELQLVLRDSLRMHRARHGVLVEQLEANDNCAFTEAQLKGKDLEELETLIKLTGTQSKRAPNYSGRSAGEASAVKAHEEEPLEMPELQFSKD